MHGETFSRLRWSGQQSGGRWCGCCLASARPQSWCWCDEVRCLSAVSVRSLYLLPDVPDGVALPSACQVVDVTGLLRELIQRAYHLATYAKCMSASMERLVIEELLDLHSAPLHLPLPADPRLNSGQPVTCVALDLGYTNASTFVVMFKRILGASPARYVRKPHARDAD